MPQLLRRHSRRPGGNLRQVSMIEACANVEYAQRRAKGPVIKQKRQGGWTMRLRLGRCLGLACAVALLLAPGSMAGSSMSSRIYRDYADNGRLDQQYSTADLQAALNDVVLQGYGNENVSAPLAPAAQPLEQTAGRALPFTGVDLALMVAGGLVLVLTGVGLR